MSQETAGVHCMIYTWGSDMSQPKPCSAEPAT
jgi:hypothetical protein